MSAEKQKLETGEFTVVETHVQRRAPEKAGPADKIRAIRFASEKEEKRRQESDITFKSLMLRTGVAAVAVLALLAVKATDTTAQPGGPAELVASALSEDSNIDEALMEEIGRLKFVDDLTADSEAVAVMSPDIAAIQSIAMPVSGTLKTTYDGVENLGLTFEVEPQSQVVSATAGLVCEVTPFEVKVGMEDGTIVGYRGITPSAEIGAMVEAGDTLGTATASDVILSVIVDNKAVDPLSVFNIQG